MSTRENIRLIARTSLLNELGKINGKACRAMYRFFQTHSCLWPCSLAVPVLAGWVYGFVVLCPGTPKGSTGNCSGFKASQKTGQQLKVSSDRLGEAGNRT